MPNQEHERERERDQTHSYWYIPSAPRENYSLLIMESTGMMKMATGEGFPLRQFAVMGLDWFSVATEASSGGTPDLLCSPMVLGYIGIYIGGRNTSGEPLGAHEGGGRARGPRGWRARPGGWARPPASCLPCCFPYVHPKSSGLLPFQK